MGARIRDVNSQVIFIPGEFEESGISNPPFLRDWGIYKSFLGLGGIWGTIFSTLWNKFIIDILNLILNLGKLKKLGTPAGSGEC